MLAYLSRYTHRVAISNRRLIAADEHSVTFKVKDYRIEGRDRYKTMTLATHEFIRRFLIHVLPKGFHRIRHYGLFANGERAAEHRASPGVARRRRARGRDRRSEHRPMPHGEGTRPSLPLLRRPHDHHRDLRGRRHAAHATADALQRHQDRHVMTATAARKRREAPWPPRRSSTRREGGRSHPPYRPRKTPQSAAPYVTIDHPNEPPLPVSQGACLVRAHRSHARSSASPKSP